MSTYMTDAIQVDVPKEGNNITLATSGTSFNQNIPARYRGRWVTVTALTSDLVWGVGDDNVDVEWGSVNTTTGEDINLSDVIGGVIPAGQSRDYRFPDVGAQYTNAAGTVAKITKFAVEAAAAGHINFALSHRRN